MSRSFDVFALLVGVLLVKSSGFGWDEDVPVSPGEAAWTRDPASYSNASLSAAGLPPAAPEYTRTGPKFCAALILCMISLSLLLTSVGWYMTSRRGQVCGNFAGEPDDGQVVTLSAACDAAEVECKFIDGKFQGFYGVKDADGRFNWARGCKATTEQRANTFLDYVYGPLPISATSYTAASSISFAACMVCACLAALLMPKARLVFATPSYSVPLSFEIPKNLSDCGCAVFFGRVTVYPIIFNILSVVFNFTVNSMITFAKVQRSGTRWPIGDVLWQSLRAPSAAFLVPSFVLQLLHFATALISTVHTFQGWIAYNAFYMSWINSGMAAFVGSGIVGGFAANSLHESFAMNLRTYGSAAFILLSAPALFTHVLPAIICWPWLALISELSLSLLFIICLPVRARYIKDTLMNCGAMRGWQGNWGVCLWMMTFVFFPLLKPVWWMSQQSKVLASQRSPLGPGMRTLVLGLYVLGKVVLCQTLFNVSTAWYFGVEYWDSVALNFLIRHWQCDICLKQASASNNLQTFAAWIKFATLF